MLGLDSEGLKINEWDLCLISIDFRTYYILTTPLPGSTPWSPNLKPKGGILA